MSAEHENNPIYQAIDNGGGQTCDIAGVIRTLNAAGFVIARKDDIGVLSAEEIISGWERFASGSER